MLGGKAKLNAGRKKAESGAAMELLKEKNARTLWVGNPRGDTQINSNGLI